MGLDGISINQLRIVNEPNSSEVNSLNQQTSPQFINGLTKGQRIDADDKNEQNHSQNQDLTKEDEEESDDDNRNNETGNINKETVIPKKYDLSDTKKYTLKIDEKTNNILIIEKSTQKIIQTFDKESLSNLTKYLKNYCGVLINRKY